MTKQEALHKYFNEYGGLQFQTWAEQLIYKAMDDYANSLKTTSLPSNPDDLFLSEIEMDIQNRKVAIGFLSWVGQEGYQNYDNWDSWIAPQNNYDVFTTEELYNKYLESLKEK